VSEDGGRVELGRHAVAMVIFEPDAGSGS